MVYEFSRWLKIEFNYTKMKRLNLICFCLFILGQISLFAEIVWTGANGADIFDEDNWDLSNSLVEVIDPNFSIDDDVIIKDATVEIPQVTGQQRFQVSSGYTITVDNSEIKLVGGSNDGIGGAAGSRLPQGPEGPVLLIGPCAATACVSVGDKGLASWNNCLTACQNVFCLPSVLDVLAFRVRI